MMKKTATSNIHAMCLAALFAALTALGAFLQIPLGLTSVTLQFLFTALAGLLLGSKWGALSQAVYVALGLVGLPVFTQGGGLGYLVKPSMGFLLGLIPAAWLVGRLTRGTPSRWRVALGCLAGLGVLYLVGLPYMYCVLNLYLGKGMSLWSVAKAGMVIFLPGDGLKIAVVTALAPTLLRRLPRA